MQNEITVPKQQRVWEIDFVRGILIIMMVLDHTSWWFYRYIYLQEISNIDFESGLYSFSVWCKQLQLESPIRDGIRIFNIYLFFLISGISTTFSGKLKLRVLILWAFPLLLYAVDYITLKTIKYPVMGSYGFFFCFALCSTLYLITRKLPAKYYYIISGIIFTIGVVILFTVPDLTSSPVRWIGLTKKLDTGWRDDFPIFPYLMCYIVGTVLGKTVYKRKTSLFLNCVIKKDVVIQFCGRHTFLIFIIQFVVYPIVFVAWAVIVN